MTTTFTTAQQRKLDARKNCVCNTTGTRVRVTDLEAYEIYRTSSNGSRMWAYARLLLVYRGLPLDRVEDRMPGLRPSVHGAARNERCLIKMIVEATPDEEGEELVEVK